MLFSAARGILEYQLTVTHLSLHKAGKVTVSRAKC